MSELVLHTHLNSEAAKRDAGKWRGVVVGEIKSEKHIQTVLQGLLAQIASVLKKS